ncbi:alpha/beta hydrolase family protein [Shewanella surugensis]|uniref:Alpha/beta fold hydrolase n=1 Tax=Shewanella surugensis TaxID=212020 RepID=A0ABT0LCI7_9GAMM|nr:alpha/beta fold hydrolase [Shewanella surugensis]MCL1124896.1 alpha/beta fold hydrolase [Shewanella surugensis]
MEAKEVTHTTIRTKDGFNLAATLYASLTPAKCIVIINSATGVKKQYYTDYAQFLSQEGIIVLCYDYRGIGGSQPKKTEQRKQMRMQDWGELDFSACITWCQEHHAQLPIVCLGHSVGAQIIGLANNNNALSACLSLSGQSGYWRHWDKKKWPKLWLAWYGIIPIMSQVFGYLPRTILGSEPLPKGIAQQWAKWARNPDYICDENGIKWRPYFSQVHSPMHFYAISDDDDFAPLKSVKALAQFYRNASVTLERLHPEDHAIPFIGHFGFFKKTMPRALWQTTSDQITTMLEQPITPPAGIKSAQFNSA